MNSSTYICGAQRGDRRQRGPILATAGVSTAPGDAQYPKLVFFEEVSSEMFKKKVNKYLLDARENKRDRK